MGVDIEPGSSPGSGRQPRYSVVILRDGEIIASFESIEIHRLLRLVLEYHVDTIAVDNVYELAPSESSLRRLLELLPSGVKVVQVTGPPGSTRSMGEIARELGVSAPQTPLKTAYVNALAAYKGVGSQLKIFSEKTKIVVTKGRSVSQGGMSRDRFLRSIRASIIQATRDLKRVLDEEGLDYDMMLKKSKGGLERSVFIVYAPRERLYGLVKPFKYKNVRIIVKPYRSRRLFTDERELRRPVIVGVDPGMSAGVAVITLDGEPLLAVSVKNPDRDEIIEAVAKLGKPVIVAVDVAKPPETVVKLASMLNAILYTPEQDISVEDKNRIAKEYAEKYSLDIPDSHARDALAAAVKAYNSYRNTIEEVKSKLASIRGVDKYSLIAEVLKCRPLSEVLEEYFKRSVAHEQPVVEWRREQPAQQGCSKLVESVNALEALVRRLLEEKERREQYIRDLELELKLARSRKPGIEEYERRISLLEAEVEALRRRIEDKDSVVRELYSKLLALEEWIVELGRGELLLLPKAGALREWKGAVKGVYMEKACNIPSELKKMLVESKGFIVSPIVEVDSLKERIPVVKPVVVHEVGDYVLVDRGVSEKAGELWRRIEELEEIERRERILKMIEEYQKSRFKTPLS